MVILSATALFAEEKPILIFSNKHTIEVLILFLEKIITNLKQKYYILYYKYLCNIKMKDELYQYM